MSAVWQFNVTRVTWQFTASSIRDTQFRVAVCETLFWCVKVNYCCQSHDEITRIQNTSDGMSPIRKKNYFYYRIIILQSSGNISGVLHFVHFCIIVPPPSQNPGFATAEHSIKRDWSSTNNLLRHRPLKCRMNTCCVTWEVFPSLLSLFD